MTGPGELREAEGRTRVPLPESSVHLDVDVLVLAAVNHRDVGMAGEQAHHVGLGVVLRLLIGFAAEQSLHRPVTHSGRGGVVHVGYGCQRHDAIDPRWPGT